jgi:hypothetical protein
MKHFVICGLIGAMMVAGGCAGSSMLLKAKSASVCTDVFTEATGGGIAPPGYTNLRVSLTASDVHGTEDYQLLLNIDGQAVLLSGTLRSENCEPAKLVDPEAGDGIRYRFNRTLQLKAGTHRIVVAIPADDLAVEREINLPEGNNSLVVEPVYGAVPGSQRPGYCGTTSFTHGLKWLRVVLNDKMI